MKSQINHRSLHLLGSLVGVLLCGIAITACSDAASAFDASGWNPAGDPDARDGAGDSGSAPDVTKPPQNLDVTSGPDDAPAPPPPPQSENDFDLRTPEAGLTRLYIPSAGLDAVVVVDAGDGLGISLVDAGSRPTILRALRNDSGAIVLNEDSADVSIITPVTGNDGVVTYDVRNLDVLPHHNRMELSPGKNWAFAWYDASRPGPAGSLNDVSAIRLKAGEEPVVFNLAVGLRPRAIRFANAGQLAVIEADNGLSGVDLTVLDADTFLPPVPVHDDAFIVANDREVVVAPNGKWAVVRELDRKELTLVDLFANTRKVVSLPDWPSDLDLTPDGGAVVVPFVDSQQVAILAVPGAWDAAVGTPLTDNPEVSVRHTGHPFGSALINGDGTRALLYTTQVGVLAVGLLNLTQPSVSVRPVAKGIARAAISPDGGHAVIVNRRLSGKQAPENNSDAYTIIELEQGFEYLELTKAEPSEVFFSEQGDIYVLVPDPLGHNHEVHRVRDFAVSVYETPQAPLFLGVLPGVNQAAVMLDDPTGWLTFIGLEDGAIDQVNSFELNSFIE